MKKHQWLLDYIDELFKKTPNFTGKIEANCFEGGVTDVFAKDRTTKKKWEENKN